MIISWTLVKILAGTSLLALLHGILGCFALLRKQSLLGDMVAHATLPGICLGFLIMQGRSWLMFATGVSSGIIGVLFAHTIYKYTKLKLDACLGIVLSGFFGLGTLLLSFVQQSPYPGKAGLYTLLFGNGSNVLHHDVYTIALTTSATLLIFPFLYRPLTIATFDSQFAQSINISEKWVDFIFLLILTSGIVVSLPIIGIVLMSSMLITPAVTARLWAKNIPVMILISVACNVIASCSGVLMSSSIPHLATGPLIVINLTIFAGISLIFSPQGILIKYIKRKLAQKQFIEDCMLLNFTLFNEFDEYPYKAHDVSAFKAVKRPMQKQALQRLQNKGYLHNPKPQFWGLTHTGLQRIKTLQHCHLPKAIA